MIDESFRRRGLKETWSFADKLMQNGYTPCDRAVSRSARRHAFRPKYEIIAPSRAEVKEIETNIPPTVCDRRRAHTTRSSISGATGTRSPR